MEKILIRKYITDIILIIAVVSFLTYVWFNIFDAKILRESLQENNLTYNNLIAYNGFDYLELDNNYLTKNLEVINKSNKKTSFIISFKNLSNIPNNYIYYKLTDSNGYESDLKTMSLDGYILENNIKAETKKKYKIILYADKNIKGNLSITLNPNRI